VTATSKIDFRRAWLENYPAAEERLQASRLLCSKIATAAEFLNARYVALYCAQPWEIDVSLLWRSNPNKCAFPRVISEKKALEFCLVAQLSELKPGFAGIGEPPHTTGCRVEIGERGDLILVPGIRFDRWGGRIGSGAGYYDRFLKDKTALKWGVCYARQLSNEKLAQESTDVRMDSIVTESSLHEVSQAS